MSPSISWAPPVTDHTVDARAIAAALNALDSVLLSAIERIDGSSDRAHAPDPFRGLHLGAEDVARAFSREPVVPAFGSSCEPLVAAVAHVPTLACVADAHCLSAFETACVLLALAPDVDPRYERIYAYLQDDITRKRPTPALALDLFCTTAEKRLNHARALTDASPLFRHQILQARAAEGASRLSAALYVDTQILRYVLGDPGLDRSLDSWCRLMLPLDSPMPATLGKTTAHRLRRLVEQAMTARAPFVAHFRGAHGTGKLQTARGLASLLGKPLLVADLRGALRSREDFTAAAQRVVREATLRDALLFLHGYDALAESRDHQALRDLEHVLRACATIVMVAGTSRWQSAGDTPLSPVAVDFNSDDTDRRRQSWAAALTRRAIRLRPAELDLLAERFRLTWAQIESAVDAACVERTGMASSGKSRRAPSPPDLSDLARAARARCGETLEMLARRIVPRRSWRDLVLPPETLAVLREIGGRLEHRRRVLTDWGFDAHLTLGKGVTALFAGPSGTGKTLAAEVIAGELGLDLFRIDLARVVSKYIGETEKNLDRVFDAVRDANAVLLFDEAEALFGKRTDVRDAHDRYANLEIAYLLQKMEEFEGLAILSTNMRQNVDEAFTRRLAFTVHFPFPDEADRRRIWDVVWPAETPRASDVESSILARELVLSGGGIKNAALAAAFYAAADGGVVTRVHVLQGARREFQKMGKVAPVERVQ